jgi:hypothetical protein
MVSFEWFGLIGRVLDLLFKGQQFESYKPQGY